MSAWILSIVGVTVLGVLVELIMPDGENRKYIKGVFAVIVVLVIVAPLPKLLKKEIDIGALIPEDGIGTDAAFIDEFNSSRKAADLRDIQKLLENGGYGGAKASIFTALTDTYAIERINVDVTDCQKTKIECENDIVKLLGKKYIYAEVRVYDNKP